MAASKVGESGTVLSFEPSDDNAGLLRENALLNAYHCLRVRNHAIGKDDGIFPLAVDGIDGALITLKASWVENLVTDKDRISYKPVLCKRMDEVFAEEWLAKIDLMKIDVEGSELDVLEGCTQLLTNRSINKIIIEVHEPVVY